MAYLDQEESAEGGELLELYEWTTNIGRILLTSADTPVLFNLDRYLPTTITRTQPTRESEEEGEQVMNVTVPKNLPLVQRYVAGVPPTLDVLRLLRGHASAAGVTISPDGTINIPGVIGDEVIIYYEGTVGTVSFKGPTASLRVLAKNSVLDRVVPKRTYRAICNHVLYDQSCDVDSSLHDFTVTVLDVTGNFILLSGVPAIGVPAEVGLILPTHFRGGALEQLASGDKRMVQSLTYIGPDASVRMITPFEEIEVGSPLRLTAGCDHSFTTCGAKFDNKRRFGGFHTIPGEDDNPFVGKIA